MEIKDIMGKTQKLCIKRQIYTDQNRLSYWYVCRVVCPFCYDIIREQSNDTDELVKNLYNHIKANHPQDKYTLTLDTTCCREQIKITPS